MDSSDSKGPASSTAGETSDDLVLRLEDCNVHPHARYHDGKTGLIFAAMLGPNTLIEELLSKGADIEARDNKGKTALYWAAVTDCYVNTLETLLKHGANVEARDIYGETPLLAVARCRKDWRARKLLDAGADANASDQEGYTVLHHAILAQSLPIVRMLLKHPGIQIDTMKSDGGTPLMTAAMLPMKELAEELINAGADVNKASPTGVTALHFAAANSRGDIIDVLLDNEANIHAKDVRGQTPLHSAARFATSNIVPCILIANGADRDAQDYSGRTPIFLAAEESNTIMCRDLMSLYVNWEIPDHHGRLPRDVALQMEHMDIVWLFDNENVPAG